MRLQGGTSRFFAYGVAMFFIGASLAFNASAATVGIVFTATTGSGTPGTDEIGAEPGDLLTAIVSIEPDAAGISSYGISVLFDMDLGNELDLASVTELLNAPFTFNFDPGCASTQESTGAQEGQVLTCEAGTFGTGPPPPTSVAIMELQFFVTANVVDDSFDIELGFFNPGFDGVFDNAGGSVIPIFGRASVNVIPEPNTALLLGLGFVGLASRLRKRIL